MKKLKEYITESLSDKLLEPSKDRAYEASDLMNRIYNTLKCLKDQISLTNKTDCAKLFRELSKNVNGVMRKGVLSTFGIDTFEKFTAFLYNNAAKLLDPDGKYKWAGKIPNIKQFNMSKLESDYKKWKESENYVEPHKWDAEEFDPNDLERTIVIYDRVNGTNPDTTLEFTFHGIRGKETDHQVNMLRVEWCYRCGFKLQEKYFDAYPKLAKNYYKYGPAKYEPSFIDLNEQE